MTTVTVLVENTARGAGVPAEHGVPLLGRIPFNSDVVTGGDAGSPFEMLDAGAPTAQAFCAIVDRIREREKP